MKSSCLFCVISATLLLCLKISASLKSLHLGHCVISVNIHEIRHSFAAIKEMTQSKDERTDIRILHKSYSLQNTEPMDRCCFLRRLLRFYLATVFSHYKASSPLVSRKVSSIANSFLSIKKELRLCHEVSMCHCGEDVKHKCGQILSQYEKMDVASAGLKAFGELDILLDWMDKAD
ncbi:interleukin-20-like [Chelonoidis abingdonii]|uniref:interleukin-20-like n=1 Tax=Chelonoidis abingdonii TaxID=106734 RepID=UPI0013F2B015|nr:interleukin-20-like [Chelonoidis abingdonii]